MQSRNPDHGGVRKLKIIREKNKESNSKEQLSEWHQASPQPQAAEQTQLQNSTRKHFSRHSS